MAWRLTIPALSLLLASSLVACDPQGATDTCPKEQAVNPFKQANLQIDLINTPRAPAPGDVTAPTGDRPLNHVWVLDHSGSMYPGYTPGRKRTPDQLFYVELEPFRELVVKTLGKGFVEGRDKAHVLLFNEFAYSWDGRLALPWPQKLDFQKDGASSLEELGRRISSVPRPPYGRAAVAGLLPPKPGATDCSQEGAGPNCSRMAQGLDAAIAALEDAGGEGIIWMVTDNIYEGRPPGAVIDPAKTLLKDLLAPVGGNPGSALGQLAAGALMSSAAMSAMTDLSQAELETNRAFYERLRDDARLHLVYAYPVRQPGGGWLKDSSLFVYGMYYSKFGRPGYEEQQRLNGGLNGQGPLQSKALQEAMVAYSAPESPSRGYPFRLKPMDSDLVRIRLATEIEAQPGREFGEPVRLRATLQVENQLHHRRITTLSFRLRNDKWVGYDLADKLPMKTIKSICTQPGFGTQDITIGPIPPGGSQNVAVDLKMPGVQTEWHSLGDLWELAGNDKVVMGGALRAELTRLRTELAIPEGDMKSIYGVAALPEIFANPVDAQYTSIFAARTKPIENPGTVAALMALAALVLLLALIGLISFLARRVGRELVVDGISHGNVMIGRLLSTPIDHRGQRLASARLSLGGAVVVRGAPGYMAQNQGGVWQISPAGARSGPPIQVELRPLSSGASRGPVSGPTRRF